MKKKILFVDDESLVLQGLQRMLRPMRDDWEMEFLDSGAKALERMTQTSFDVVVSDMRMPGMNGADLLNQVMKLYPKTVRLILSGHADRELILKCVGSTHQFLAKPCEADALKATVLRASGLAYIGFALAHPHVLRLMFSPSARGPTPAVHEQAQRAWGNLLRAVALHLGRGVADERTLASLAVAAWAQVHGLAMLWTDVTLPPEMADPATAEHLRSVALDVLVAGIDASAGRPRRARRRA